MQDSGIKNDNIAEQLMSKGRSKDEAEKRAKTQQWSIYAKFMEEEWCDYIIINEHNSSTNQWNFGKKELLNIFKRILQEFQEREQEREEGLKIVAQEDADIDELRKRYLRIKWNLEPDPSGAAWIYEKLKGKNIAEPILRNLYREFRMQRWLDELWSERKYADIKKAVMESKTDETEICDEIEQQYNEWWKKLENNADGLSERCYEKLVRLVPLFEEESVKDRIALLRSPYREKDAPLYKADQDWLKRRLIEIFDPDFYRE